MQTNKIKQNKAFIKTSFNKSVSTNSATPWQLPLCSTDCYTVLLCFRHHRHHVVTEKPVDVLDHIAEFLYTLEMLISVSFF